MEHLSREGKQLTSSRCDALSFGAAHANLAVNLEELISTSWGELLVRRYEGAAGMLDALCRYLGLTLLIKAEVPAPKIDAYSFSSIRARSIASRVAQVFDDACRAFAPEGGGQTARYVLQVGDALFVIQTGEQGFGWTRTETADELTELLGEPQAGFKPVVMDRNALSDSHLPVLFEHNRPHRIQLYYRPQEGQLELSILDENGELFQQTLRSDNHRQRLIQQQRFLNSMLRYRSLFFVYPGHEPLLEEPEFFLLRRDRNGNWRAEPKRLPQVSVMDNYLELRLITSGSGRQVRPFALVCGDEEFNVLEYGDALYPRVARHILGLRSNGSRYPIYLTTVETSDNDLDQRPSSIGILNLKKRVETRLNQALQDVTLPERNNQDNPTA
jgi:adenylate cyclase class 1